MNSRKFRGRNEVLSHSAIPLRTLWLCARVKMMTLCESEFLSLAYNIKR